MIARFRTEGFIFKREERLEADCLFSIFTREFGRVEILAKAMRKINSKLSSQSKLFSLAEIEFIQGKNKKTLTDARSLNKFDNLKSEPEKLMVAYRMSHILNDFIYEQEADEKIFNLIVEFFNLLNSTKATKANLIFEYFFWNLITIVGYAPVLQHCVHCRGQLQENRLFFSCQEGGVLCQNCAKIKKDSFLLSGDTIKVLRLFLKKDWPTLSRLKMSMSIWSELKKISQDYKNFKYET